MKFIMNAPSFIKGESLYTTDYTLEEVMHSSSQRVILVPTLGDYHEVRGQLFLAGCDRKVVCIIPPSVYTVSSAHDALPFMMVSDDYQWDSRHKDDEYHYYYLRK